MGPRPARRLASLARTRGEAARGSTVRRGWGAPTPGLGAATGIAPTTRETITREATTLESYRLE